MMKLAAHFLVGAAVGARRGARAGGLCQRRAGASARPAARRRARRMRTARGLGAFLNDDDSATVAAFTERLMPGAPGKPGARDAGVLNYIDLALAGAYQDLQDFYRRGLAALDAYCQHDPQAVVRAACRRASRTR